jgi:hypothetical protein
MAFPAGRAFRTGLEKSTGSGVKLELQDVDGAARGIVKAEGELIQDPSAALGEPDRWIHAAAGKEQGET